MSTIFFVFKRRKGENKRENNFHIAKIKDVII